MDADKMAYLVQLLDRVEAAGRDDDIAALVILTTLLTEEAGAPVEALGFGACNGKVVPLVVECSTPEAAAAITALFAACGLVQVDQRHYPADQEAPSFPNGGWVVYYDHPRASLVGSAPDTMPMSEAA